MWNGHFLCVFIFYGDKEIPFLWENERSFKILFELLNKSFMSTKIWRRNLNMRRLPSSLVGFLRKTRPQQQRERYGTKQKV